VKNIQQVLDVQTLSRASNVCALSTNEIGRVDFILQKPIATDLFEQSPRTGAFILIDEVTNLTVAAGMIREIISE
jgi:sulfate adenylyltransferase subunit 1